jgi:hypothetical protein
VLAIRAAVTGDYETEAVADALVIELQNHGWLEADATPPVAATPPEGPARTAG